MELSGSSLRSLPLVYLNRKRIVIEIYEHYINFENRNFAE